MTRRPPPSARWRGGESSRPPNGPSEAMPPTHSSAARAGIPCGASRRVDAAWGGEVAGRGVVATRAWTAGAHGAIPVAGDEVRPGRSGQLGAHPWRSVRQRSSGVGQSPGLKTTRRQGAHWKTRVRARTLPRRTRRAATAQATNGDVRRACRNPRLSRLPQSTRCHASRTCDDRRRGLGDRRTPEGATQR
jgi:hypothetical protein